MTFWPCRKNGLVRQKKYIKLRYTNYIKLQTIDPEICSEKGLGLVSPLHFVYDFFKKMFLMLYSIN